MKIFLTGASTGIGRALAEALCADGHEVWGTSRHTSRLPDSSQLKGFHPVQLDLNEEGSIENAVSQVMEEASRVDVLINNAGNGIFAPMESISSDQWRAQVETMLFGPIELTHALLPHMRKAVKEGHSALIIHTSSLGAQLPIPFMGAYSVAKAGFSAFAWLQQMELAGQGIQIVDLQPGDIRTEFHPATERPQDFPDDYRKAIEVTWKMVDYNMTNAPLPKIVVGRVMKVVRKFGRGAQNLSGREVVGDFFQGTIAPLLIRVVPRRWLTWGICKYYGI